MILETCANENTEEDHPRQSKISNKQASYLEKSVTQFILKYYKNLIPLYIFRRIQ